MHAALVITPIWMFPSCCCVVPLVGETCLAEDKLTERRPDFARLEHGKDFLKFMPVRRRGSLEIPLPDPAASLQGCAACQMVDASRPQRSSHSDCM
eukprot:267047-Amphidinium_carterae.1